MEPSPTQQLISWESGSENKISQLIARIEAQNKDLGGRLLEFLTSDSGSVSLFRQSYKSSDIIFIGGVDTEYGPILISGPTANDLVVNGSVQILEKFRGKDLKTLTSGRPGDLIMVNNPTARDIWKNALAVSEKNAEDLKKAEERDKYVDLAISDADSIFGDGQKANVLPPTTPEQKSAYGVQLPQVRSTTTSHDTIGDPASRRPVGAWTSTNSETPVNAQAKDTQPQTQWSPTVAPTPTEASGALPTLPESQPHR